MEMEIQNSVQLGNEDINPDNIITLQVSFKKDNFTIKLPTHATVGELKHILQDLTSVPIEYQKLMFKRSKDSPGADDESITASGLRDGSKIMLIGSTPSEVEAVKAIKNEGPFERKVKYTAKATTSQTKCFFTTIRALSSYPNADIAQQLLERIAHDNGIVAVMERHGWRVGLLREMSVEEAPDKLGHNVNQGMEIALRLRFEEGFRTYQSIKDVTIHELTHMQIGPHDNSFYALYRELHKEAASSDWLQSRGHALGGAEVNPNSHAEEEVDDVMAETAKSSGQKLGGRTLEGQSMRDVISKTHTSLSSVLAVISPEGKLQLKKNSNLCVCILLMDNLLQATMKRITEEEKKITEGCGNKPQGTKPSTPIETAKAETPKQMDKTQQIAPPKPAVSAPTPPKVTKTPMDQAVCPFCNTKFESDASNREINRHIDQHLTG